jgi:hypothetical protein
MSIRVFRVIRFTRDNWTVIRFATVIRHIKVISVNRVIRVIRVIRDMTVTG